MMNSNKSLGEQNYEQFAERYAAIVETKAHNAYYERPATLSLLPNDYDKLMREPGFLCIRAYKPA